MARCEWHDASGPIVPTTLVTRNHAPCIGTSIGKETFRGKWREENWGPYVRVVSAQAEHPPHGAPRAG